MSVISWNFPAVARRNIRSFTRFKPVGSMPARDPEIGSQHICDFHGPGMNSLFMFISTKKKFKVFTKNRKIGKKYFLPNQYVPIIFL